MGFAQGESSCGDFAAPEDAQMALEENPDLTGSLDSDGNGTACDEDPELFAQAADEEDTADTTTEDTIEDESDTVEETEDSSAADQQDRQTPPTGGVALLPLAGSTLTALLGGSMLIRRRV